MIADNGDSARVAAGLRGAERFSRFVASSDGIAPCFAIGAPLETVFGAIQEGFCLVQLLWRRFFGAGIACGPDGLTRIAHLLHGRAGAGRECERRDH